jgi:hypothetical protein
MRLGVAVVAGALAAAAALAAWVLRKLEADLAGMRFLP